MQFVRRNAKIILSIGTLIAVGIFVWFSFSAEEAPLSTVVDRGRVEASVTVSGIAHATESARLRFPESGTVTGILVKKGDRVEIDQPLAQIDTADLDADRRAAMADLSRSLSSRDQLIAGPRDEVLTVSSNSVSTARANLERIRSENAEKVVAARSALYTASLALVPENPGNSDRAPTVGGSYQCTKIGEYRIEIFSSGAQSGYSYRVSGLESGVYSAYTEAAGAFGECGLTLTFDEDENYRRDFWTLSIPNTRGATFNALQSALTLAEESARIAVEEASDALKDAIASAASDTAGPRSEEVRQADATVDESLARIAKIDALRERRTLRAPFSGTVTDVLPRRGELASLSDPVVILVSDKAFEVIARIPEVDVTKIVEGAAATLIFDAKESELLRGRITFISPLATAIDGVAYFDATLELTSVPGWMREGLNADVRLISQESDNAVRVLRRFLSEENGSFSAFVQSGKNVEEKSVLPGIIGSDGYVEVDLAPGTVLVAPPLLLN